MGQKNAYFFISCLHWNFYKPQKPSVGEFWGLTTKYHQDEYQALVQWSHLSWVRGISVTQRSVCFAESPRDRRVFVKGPPQTPGFSGRLAHWRGACGSLWSSASAHSASASSHSLSSEVPLEREVCRPQGLLDRAKPNIRS